MQLQLMDMLGRTVRRYTDLRGSSVLIEKQTLPEGNYTLTLQNARGMVSRKLMIH
jgi:hypothetical protein